MTTLSDMRKSAGFDTQANLAQSIGATREAVAQWEIGTAYPRAPTMQALAKALCVTTDDIIAAITAARELNDKGTHHV